MQTMKIDQITPRIRDLGIEDRIRDALSQAEFDAVVLLSVDVCQYASGYWFPYARNRLTRQNIVVWPKSEEPVLILGVDQVAGPYRYSWIRDYRTYAQRGRRPPGVIVETLASTLDDLGLRGKRIGIEFQYTPIIFFQELLKLSPGTEFIPCDDLFDELRMTKTPQEVALISDCAKAAEVGMHEALLQAKPGWTEKQLADQIRVNILDNGADDVTTILLGSGDGARGYYTPTTDSLQEGEIVRIDLNAISGGYYSDMGRMAVVGEPTQEQEDVYNKLWELNQRIIHFIRPGIKANETFQFCQDVAQDLGVTLLDQAYIGLGHSTGINNSEIPKLVGGDSTELREGMVLNIEPDIFGPEGEVMHVEEMLLVKEDGNSEVLTRNKDWSTLFRIQ